MSLRSRLLLNMTFLLLFVVCITILATNYIVRQALVAQAEVDGLVIAELMESSVQISLQDQAGKAELQRLTDDLVAHGNVLAIRVLDPQYNTLALRVLTGFQTGEQLGDEDRSLLQTAVEQNHPEVLLSLAVPTTSLSVTQIAWNRIMTIGFLTGSTLKVATPITASSGAPLGMALVELPTDRVQATMAYTFQLALIAAAFVLVYGIEFTIVTSRRLTKPIERLTAAAHAIEAGNFDPDSLADMTRRKRDELGKLAGVFVQMAREVRAREERLMHQVEELKIEIDETKKQRAVAEITETDYFRELQLKAESLRARSKPGKS